MKKGQLLKVPAGWIVTVKKGPNLVEHFPVASKLTKDGNLKHGQRVLFELNSTKIVVELKKYTPATSYRKNELSKRPGGSTLKFVYTDRTQIQEKVKFPTAYINKVLKEIENEPEFLVEVYEDGDLIWEAGEFIIF